MNCITAPGLISLGSFREYAERVTLETQDYRLETFFCAFQNRVSMAGFEPATIRLKARCSTC